MSNLTVAPWAAVARPQRWDEPFGKMSPEAVDDLLQKKPFCDFDPERFPKHLPLRDILLNDARIRTFADGEIVMREGDYGTSAFLILEGSVRVFLDKLPARMLGRKVKRKRSPFSAVAQIWNRPKFSETRTSVGASAQSNKSTSQAPESQIFIQDIPAALTAKLRHLDLDQSGELIGELAALSRTPRTATVVANGTVEMLEIRWQGLREFRSFAPEWKRRIDELFRERSLETHLLKSPLFAGLSKEALDCVMEATILESYGSFDWHDSFRKMRETADGQPHASEPKILAEGDYPNSLILVRNGFVRVSRRYNNGERTVNYLGAGQSYGMRELSESFETGSPIKYQHSLRALGYVDLLVIPAAVVEDYIIPALSEDQRRKMSQNEPFAVSSTSESKEPLDHTVEFLVEHRFINGTQSMLIDLDRCTRCDDCVRACASTHEGNPRFIRQGPQDGTTMFANACMHCSDPVCMIGCPTGAIHRAESTGEVVINDLTCVGCQTCANSCPYNNIHMVEVRSRSGDILLDQDASPILKATKCDLCSEQLTGPACERACPHDALIRMDMRKPLKLKRWLTR
ncbi:MAG: cyclic nucleotide-binding domain-containing protein [Opitutales bacterium]